MTIADACTLIALINKKDSYHEICRLNASKVSKPLLTTWVCFAEAMYLALAEGGWFLQEQLWQYPRRGMLQLYTPSQEEEGRMYELMQKYRDRPMDMGDASLVTMAETLHLTQIFTIDSDFYFYTLNGKTPFEVIPVGAKKGI